MLHTVRDLVSKQFGTKEDPAARAKGVRLATAALMVEMVRADARVMGEEAAALHGLLARHFDIAPDECRALIAAAEREADAAVSLHGYTKLLNEVLSAGEKQRVLELLWKLAFADHELDRYEEHLVRKVADLLYVSHADLIRAKLAVQEAIQKAGGAG